jgi:putative membrane protein
MMKDENSLAATVSDGAIVTLIKGGLVGIANIIPGVSGGTFALILGIFDRLVGSLNNIGVDTIKAIVGLIKSGFKKEGWTGIVNEWRRLDATFLVLLVAGAGAAILSSSFLIDYLLKVHWSPTLAFFVGLILPSVAIPWAMMDRRGLVLLWAIPGIVLTVGVSLVIPDSAAGMDNPLWAFVTGAIAISAMILPGLSGSYVMLVMGQYQNVLTKLTGLQVGITKGQIDYNAVIWLGALAIGMAIGIVLFARLLHFLLKRSKSATMAFLIGLLVGSLWILWPFKDIDAGAQVRDRHGEVKEEVKIATAPNCLPKTAGEGMLAGGAFVAGLIGSGGLIVIGRRRKSNS